MYEIVRNLQLDYVVSKSHYIAAPEDGTYTTLKDKKTKVVNVLYLYFVYKTSLLEVDNHLTDRMEKLFQVPEGLGASKCLYDEAKYTNYLVDELRMEFYLRMTRRRDSIINIFAGSKPIYASMINNFEWLVHSLG